MYRRVNALPREKITFEFQTIDSQLTARGAGSDAIGRKLDKAADAFTNKLFLLLLHGHVCLNSLPKNGCILQRKKYAADISIRCGELTGDASG